MTTQTSTVTFYPSVLYRDADAAHELARATRSASSAARTIATRTATSSTPR